MTTLPSPPPHKGDEHPLWHKRRFSMAGSGTPPPSGDVAAAASIARRLPNMASSARRSPRNKTSPSRSPRPFGTGDSPRERGQDEIIRALDARLSNIGVGGGAGRRGNGTASASKSKTIASNVDRWLGSPPSSLHHNAGRNRGTSMSELLRESIPVSERLMFSTALAPNGNSADILDFDEYRAWLAKDERESLGEIKIKPYLPTYFENTSTAAKEAKAKLHGRDENGDLFRPGNPAEVLSKLEDAQQGFRILEDIQKELHSLKDSAEDLNVKISNIETKKGVASPTRKDTAIPREDVRSAKLRLIRLLRQDIENEDNEEDER